MTALVRVRVVVLIFSAANGEVVASEQRTGAVPASASAAHAAQTILDQIAPTLWDISAWPPGLVAKFQDLATWRALILHAFSTSESGRWRFRRCSPRKYI